MVSSAAPAPLQCCMHDPRSLQCLTLDIYKLIYLSTSHHTAPPTLHSVSELLENVYYLLHSDNGHLLNVKGTPPAIIATHCICLPTHRTQQGLCFDGRQWRSSCRLFLVYWTKKLDSSGITEEISQIWLGRFLLRWLNCVMRHCLAPITVIG